MNSEMTDLAREAVAADGYHLMRGMTLTSSEITVLVTHRLFDCHDVPTGFWETEPIEGEMLPRSPLVIHEDDEWWPVLEDAATRGCLLEMVRELFVAPVFVERRGIQARVTKWMDLVRGTDLVSRITDWRPTEAHALVTALKAGGER